MAWMDALGYLGALLTLTTFSMKTMLHLRRVGIASNLAFIAYGALGHVYPVLMLHLLLLPLNIWRLRQVVRLTQEIEQAASGSFSVEWLKPFSRRKAYQAGDTLFRKGDAADEMGFVLNGRFRAVEPSTELKSGDLIGELGLISRSRQRTQTVVCDEPGALLVLSYDEARQMYFQNPRFGFFLLELAAERLLRDADRGRSVSQSAAPNSSA